MKEVILKQGLFSSLYTGLKIEVVPAYSMAHMQSPRVPFLPQNVVNESVSSETDVPT